MGRPHLPTKVCATCGRTFAWRKKWARDWDEVRYCSDRCRAHRAGGTQADLLKLETRILALLNQGARAASICPSDVLAAEEKHDATRMDAARAAARRLAHGGDIDILQRGVVVDPDHARGPIRLRLRVRSR